MATQGIHHAGKLNKQKLVLGSQDEQRQEMFFTITVTWILEISLIEMFQNKGNCAKKLQGKMRDLWLPQPFLLDAS